MPPMEEITGALSGIAAGARFFALLPWYLRRPVSPDEARRMIGERIATRESRFLDRLREDVFGQPGSPYDQLLRHAGCEPGDLERMVNRDGLEKTLRCLLQAGVYLSVDEFKGRTPVRRGSLRLDLATGQLRSPRAAYHLPASSGGSRGGGTPVLIDLRFVRTCAAGTVMCRDVWNIRGSVKADWETPGAGARFRLAKFGMFGEPAEAWFTQIDPGDGSLPAFIRWNTHALRWSSFLAGKAFPAPAAAPLSDPAPVVRWLAEVVASGRTPMVFTFPGSAVRACQAAASLGISIEGTRFLIAGEPITPARLETIRQSGCVAIPRYGSMECGAIGYGCPNAQHADDVHLLTHMHALVNAGRHAAALGTLPEALYVTALDPYSPFLMINTSMGDQAVIEQRPCGCEWEAMGLSTHLHAIRSYEKLTGGGVTFHGADVIPILEQVLPRAFGGTPTDYQLVEEESATGDPILVLHADPSLGEVDEKAMINTFLDHLSAGSNVSEVMARMWRDSGTLRVVRKPPIVSRVGKILHLAVNRPR